MSGTHPPVENYPFLAEFRLPQQSEEREQHIAVLQQQLSQAQSQLPENSGLALEYLAAREQSFMEVVSSYFAEIHQHLITENLASDNAFRMLARNTHLLDAILLVTADYVLEDLPAVKEILVDELERECNYKLRVLPEKAEKRRVLRDEIAQYANPESTDEQNLGNYYRRVLDELSQEIGRFQTQLEEVQKLLPQVRNCSIDPKEVLEHLVVFARGGYGRAELSFASDRDLGYCLDTRHLEVGAVKLYQQVVVRIEQLLNRAGIETAHQYFEIDEDLSRFREPGSLHTIPSILESRVLLGSPELAAELKHRFFQVLPYEPYVLSKIQEYHGRQEPSLNLMNLKEDHGGLRTLQIPLWIAAATFGEFPSQTADLLALLIQRRILTPRQGLKVCQALEFFYDLRNFSGAAQHYYDEEAQASGCVDTDLKANIINDSLERLYLLKKRRFRTVDEFDRFRLQMVHNIQMLSRTILRKLLDRTIVRTFSSFQAVVQLRKRRIVEVHALEGLPQVPLPLIFNTPTALLDLFVYLAESGYKLSLELKDELAELLPTITPETMQADRVELRTRFSALMIAPYAADALESMLEISDPFEAGKGPDTLLGRFIPECNEMRFLLRNLSYHQRPVCLHSLRAVQNGEEELGRLRTKYPELHQFLERKHILALKWGLLFHDVGKIDPQSRHQISGTSIAVRALERLGYDDAELFQLVSLLIVHHMTVVQLSRTSAYFDQALQSFFEIADRNVLNVVLLYLVNISDYRAVSDANERDTRHLRDFFDEAFKLYAEMRSSGMPEGSLDVIQTYLDNKKQDLEFDTRIHLLIDRSLQEDLESTLLTPLEQINPREREQLRSGEDALGELWRELKLGSLDTKGINQTTDRLIRMFRQHLSNATITELTASFNPAINWFFMAFPNRFLLSAPPDLLSQNLNLFQHTERRVVASVLTNARRRVNGVLLYAHELPDIHRRVAYALSQRQFNIESAKMNKVQFLNGRIGFCYYVEVSQRGKSELTFPRELETSILRDSPPPLRSSTETYDYTTRVQIEHLEDDQKGYLVEERPPKSGVGSTRFRRRPQEYHLVRITAEDAFLVYYKMALAFEQAQVPIQQSLITTTGHQVTDIFYILLEDRQTLLDSNFEENLRQLLSTPAKV